MWYFILDSSNFSCFCDVSQDPQKKAIVSKTFITKNGCRNCNNLKRDNWYVFPCGVLPVFHLKLNAILLPRIVKINSQPENQTGPITKISAQKI